MAPAGDDPEPDREADVDELLTALHDHLVATGERPVDREAARWLGEAEAVVADVADGDTTAAAVRTRLEQVRELLSHVEGTGDEAADDHVASARRLLEAAEDQA